MAPLNDWHSVADGVGRSCAALNCTCVVHVRETGIYWVDSKEEELGGTELDSCDLGIREKSKRLL